MAGGGTTIEYTPTWVVGGVCSVIVVISLTVERLLHKLGKLLKKKNQRNLYEALQKIKEELMLLGFISLLLTVCQGFISKICIPKKLAKTWLPCRENQRTKLHPIHGIKKDDLEFLSNPSFHFHPRVGRHLLAVESGEYYCKKQGKVPLLPETALHHLHIFIFVLAVSHVTFCGLTVIFGGAKKIILSREIDLSDYERIIYAVLERKLTNVREHDFVKNRFLGVGKRHAIIGWMQAFCKQFFVSVNKADYTTLRHGFVMNHCRTNPKFNFHNYVTRAFEADFKKVVGISWHLWVIVVIFLLANVQDLHAYFWISFVPLI
ncbi:hypothetical protein CISIN_1g0474501mg, partial [Citrus sinensis]